MLFSSCSKDSLYPASRSRETMELSPHANDIWVRSLHMSVSWQFSIPIVKDAFLAEVVWRIFTCLLPKFLKDYLKLSNQHATWSADNDSPWRDIMTITFSPNTLSFNFPVLNCSSRSFLSTPMKTFIPGPLVYY
jgi:hypothetical protein